MTPERFRREFNRPVPVPVPVPVLRVYAAAVAAVLRVLEPQET